MTKTALPICLLLLLGSTFSCQNRQENANQVSESLPTTEKSSSGIDTLYKSENLILVQLAKHTFQHISYLSTNDYGRVACNGMVVVNNKEAIIFDTPADNASTEELIRYLTQTLGSKITAVVPTHFHADCLGGIEVVQKNELLPYASNKTIELLRAKGNKYASIMKGFDDKVTLSVGGMEVYAEFFGEGHTRDNIIGYVPADSMLFGGCLLKELNATKGNLEDANVEAWPATVLKIKQTYPQINHVIPGHGKSGGADLLDYTITLFKP